MLSKPFHTVATAIAFSPNMEANISESIRITRMIGKELLLIHVGDFDAEMEKKVWKAVEAAGGDRAATSLIWESGDPTEALLRVAEKHQVDLLIAGALPREGLLRYYRGSIARRLVRKANCSILLMTHPHQLQSNCGKIVVNGLRHPKTEHTVKTALAVAEHFGSSEVQIIEEVEDSEVGTRIEDDASLVQASEVKQEIEVKEQTRIKRILDEVQYDPELYVNQKVIFGRKGYSIGHFAQTICADLLVMNNPDTKLGFLDRVFTHDLEYILSELPCDLLIVHSRKN